MLQSEMGDAYMATTPKQGSDDVNAFMASFADGAIRKQLGLQSIDLQAGLEIAKNYLKRGAHLEAMRTYVALVLCEPMNVDFQVGLANCALQMNQHHLALQAASAVVAMAPSDARGYFLSGRACLALGHLAEASEDLRDAIEKAKNSQDKVIVTEATQLLQKLAALQS
jgi:tetratricopeptide (TPR) repeat protein